MCESNIIKRKDKKETVIAEDIAFIKIISKGKLLIRTILGEERYIEGDIEEIDLHGHKVIVKD
ncbi:MAG: CooT family nickel-binding protein [Candidatus Omnitrophota bacterium]